ncbi:MAG TPA: hypothetical protein VF395_05335 [Polyangiaceae bacterium]
MAPPVVGALRRLRVACGERCASGVVGGTSNERTDERRERVSWAAMSVEYRHGTGQSDARQLRGVRSGCRVGLTGAGQHEKVGHAKGGPKRDEGRTHIVEHSERIGSNEDPDRRV